MQTRIMLCLTGLMATAAFAQEFTVEEKDATSKKPAYSPFIDQLYPILIWPVKRGMDLMPTFLPRSTTGPDRSIIAAWNLN